MNLSFFFLIRHLLKFRINNILYIQVNVNVNNSGLQLYIVAFQKNFLYHIAGKKKLSSVEMIKEDSVGDTNQSFSTS